MSEIVKNISEYYEIVGNKFKFHESAFINRELSWLDFNKRVLNQSKDYNTPLFEKLNFLSITTNNLDEFIRVRVASLKEQYKNSANDKDISGLTAKEQLDEIAKKMHKFIDEQYKVYNKQIIEELRAVNLRIIKYKDLTNEQKEKLDKYFYQTVFPILTPMAVDSSRPFPLIQNRVLNIALTLKKKKEHKYSMYHESKKNVKNEESFFASLEIPSNIPRLIDVSKISQKNDDIKLLILLEDLIAEKLDEIFQGFYIDNYSFYRVLRNADFELEEDIADDLLKEIQKRVRERDFAEVIHLEVDKNIDESLLKVLKKNFSCKKNDVYYVNGPLDLRFVSKIKEFSPSKIKEQNTYKRFQAVWPLDFRSPNKVKLDKFNRSNNGSNSSQLNSSQLNSSQLNNFNELDLFQLIKEKDRFISLPYESFDPIEKMISDAAKDEKVLAIKQTLYRVSGNSPIVASLAEAARNGKQVLVLVELKARFDEANNINWARQLEMAGCHVIYGLIGLKTHSKITMIVRNEEEGIRRYVHLGTGNYNDATAKIYSDCGIFTAKEEIGEDASNFFNLISGYTEPKFWHKLIVAPFDLRRKLISLIDREIQIAKEGKQAFIRAKMNSLSDKEMIEKLYEASIAGVKIELIVRGINCLRAGVKGLSENIKVRSLIGKYLEHSRIYQFSANGSNEIYMSSADFMSRNLNRRVELLFPILDDACKKRAEEILNLQLSDNQRAFVMGADGVYKKINIPGQVKIDSMKIQEEQVEKISAEFCSPLIQRKFIPTFKETKE